MAKPDLFGGGSTIYDAQRVYTESGLQPGTVGLLGGRSYVWCSYSGSGELVRGEPLVAGDLNYTTQNLQITTGGLHVGQTAIVDITAGAAAITDGDFDEGYMAVTDGGGEGNTYEIAHNTGFTAATADGIVDLRDAVVVASDASTEVTLIKNKYVDPQQSNQLGACSFIGVPNVTVPDGSTNKQFFWAQRSGYCLVFVKGAAKKGTAVIVSSSADGRLEAVTTDVEVYADEGMSVVPFDTTQVVGIMVTDAIDGEVQLVDLQNTIV